MVSGRQGFLQKFLPDFLSRRFSDRWIYRYMLDSSLILPKTRFCIILGVTPERGIKKPVGE